MRPICEKVAQIFAKKGRFWKLVSWKKKQLNFMKNHHPSLYLKPKTCNEGDFEKQGAY